MLASKIRIINFQLVEIFIIKYFSQSCCFRRSIAFMNVNFVYWFHCLINITTIITVSYRIRGSNKNILNCDKVNIFATKLFLSRSSESECLFQFEVTETPAPERESHLFLGHLKMLVQETVPKFSPSCSVLGRCLQRVSGRKRAAIPPRQEKVPMITSGSILLIVP